MIFILGGGPGLFKVPFKKLEGRRCIAVNNSYRVAPWAETVFFGDVKWWDWHSEELLGTGMPISTCCENVKLKQHMGKGKYSRIKFYSRDHSKRAGITTKPGDYVSWNNSSGAAAISLAYKLGAKKIVLLGFDMRMVDGQKNWHDDHVEKKHNPFNRHLKTFPAIAKDARALGLNIYNATPNSAIKQFPIVDLEDFI